MDIFSKAKRSRIMSAVKSSNNKTTEEALVYLFRKEKLTGWRRRSRIHGKPDFVFPANRIALFVDGCQWHGCKKHFRLPKTNSIYWEKKIGKNMMRDKRNRKILIAEGWTVFRIWEHEIKNLVKTKKYNKIRYSITK